MTLIIADDAIVDEGANWPDSRTDHAVPRYRCAGCSGGTEVSETYIVLNCDGDAQPKKKSFSCLMSREDADEMARRYNAITYGYGAPYTVHLVGPPLSEEGEKE